MTVWPVSARAIVNQVDGSIVPQSVRLQSCLDKSQTLSGANPAPGEGAGVLDAVRDASTFPQTFIPAVTAGRRLVNVTVLGEGGGFRNRFGWYNVGDNPAVPASRREIYGCRDANVAAGCGCPCTAGPRLAVPAAGACQRWINANTVELDFDCLRTSSSWRGGPVAFYLLTPEPAREVRCTSTPECAFLGAGSYCSMGLGRCVIGGACAPATTTDSRVYSTDETINDDGDYVHFLIYTSRSYRNAFYFGFEDLFRGGDNDFEDMLVRATGLTPSCTPSPEVCDGRDNDCNGLVDDGVAAGGSCGAAVGVCTGGTLQCMMGRFQCVGGTTGSAEICDGLDNDCDGTVDEGDPGGGASCATVGGTEPLCRPGTLRCRAGRLVCEGGVRGTAEICDCLDNNCNGMVDEEAAGSLCPGGGRCIACGCRTPCAQGEFPCSPGLECRMGFCLPGECGGVVCRDNERCLANRCVNPCETLTCMPGTVCRSPSGIAQCVENNCYGLGCPAGQVCSQSACVPDPCTSVTCGENEFCRAGTCVRSCGTVLCRRGQSCNEGVCEPNACLGTQCLAGQTCVAGTCVADPCASVQCGVGRVCSEGACIDDPCARVRCPGATERCLRGNCVRDDLPTLGEPDQVVGSGGGCSASPQGGRVVSWAPMIFALAALWMSSRRRAQRAAKTQGLLSLGAVCVGVMSGCEARPFCLNCTDVTVPNVDVVVQDMAVRETSCSMSTMESCNGVDDDCDGVIDNGFDLQTNPRHCGACDNACLLTRAISTCAMGACRVERCDIGFYDLDRDPRNGCEYACVPSGVTEVCDGRDNDCDGQVDEGVNRMTDVSNCGMCGNECLFDRAGRNCVAGRCVMGACQDGFVDLDRDPSNGCEYACRASTELCDGRDNDCDGMVDEGCLRATPANDVRIDRTGAAATNSVRPTIAGDGTSTLAIAFMDQRNGQSDIYLARSTNDGTSWGTEMRLDRDAMGLSASINPVLGFAGTRVSTVWGDIRSTTLGVRELWTTVSNNSAGSFAGESRANMSTGDVLNLRVALLPSGPVVAVWEELLPDRSRQIRFARSVNGSAPWTDGRIDRGPAGNRAQEPVIAVGMGNDVFVAWSDTRNGLGDVYLSRSTDAGVTWSPEVRVDSDTAGARDSRGVSLAADTAGNVYVVWQDARTGRSFDIYGRASNDRGIGFVSPDRRVDTAPGDLDSIRPTVHALTGGRAVAVWTDVRAGRPNAWSNVSSDRGATWRARDAQVMGGTPGRSSSFDLVSSATSALVLAAWSDDRNGRRDIYANFSLDGGATFQPEDVRLDSGVLGAADSETPSVFVAGSVGHVTWVDRRADNVNGDIYYRALRP
ncbi:MAG: MopE-related protein [Deltaproteobacteria bacterium]|nr:MopE-related protein [Deltaproteobacteria bacterium]